MAGKPTADRVDMLASTRPPVGEVRAFTEPRPFLGVGRAEHVVLGLVQRIADPEGGVSEIGSESDIQALFLSVMRLPARVARPHRDSHLSGAIWAQGTAR